MKFHVEYRGQATGLCLRSTGADADVLDVSSNSTPGAPLTMYVSTERGAAKARAASIELDPAAVALLAEHCTAYLAAHYVPTSKKNRSYPC